LAPLVALADFGLTTTDKFYTVDTGAGLVFKIRRVDLGVSTQSPGDIASLVYNGVEYQNQSRGSQVNSGFDWLYNNVSAVTVNAEQIGTQFIKITVQGGDLTHYYIARKGYSHIYMATYFAKEPEVQALVRYIVRMPQALVPNGPVPSQTLGTQATVEASDIFKFTSGPLAGQTRSKHYSGQRHIDWTYTGATGPGVGVWMVKSNHEGDSGGPFFRCLINQNGGDQEIYEIVNYGENQTEAFRLNVLNGLYTLVFTNGTPPPAYIDTSWLQNTPLNLLGFVPNSQRGRVSGNATGIPAGFQGVVGFANARAQYWSIVNNGRFVSPAMIPGTYTQTLYKGELAVATKSVTVTAPLTPLGASTVVSDIASTEANPAVLWRIGQWDGTPKEFLNIDKVTYMHPSDVRMASWKPAPYIIGTSTPAELPGYQWKDTSVSGNIVIKFNMTAEQIGTQNRTLRVGITCAFAGGRQLPSLNGKWTPRLPSPSSQPSTRNLTVGTWRGNNALYTFTVPYTAFVVGENVLTLSVISGSSGSGYLSPGVSLDCIDLY
jgi:rhamnogalacturonan endolyase